MVDYNAYKKKNQWLLDRFKIQAITTRNKKSIIILEMCQVKRGGTFQFTMTILLLL